jgi:hypothetical protein
MHNMILVIHSYFRIHDFPPSFYISMNSIMRIHLFRVCKHILLLHERIKHTFAHWWSKRNGTTRRNSLFFRIFFLINLIDSDENIKASTTNTTMRLLCRHRNVIFELVQAVHDEKFSFIYQIFHADSPWH